MEEWICNECGYNWVLPKIEGKPKTCPRCNEHNLGAIIDMRKNEQGVYVRRELFNAY